MTGIIMRSIRAGCKPYSSRLPKVCPCPFISRQIYAIGPFQLRAGSNHYMVRACLFSEHCKATEFSFRSGSLKRSSTTDGPCSAGSYNVSRACKSFEYGFLSLSWSPLGLLLQSVHLQHGGSSSERVGLLCPDDQQFSGFSGQGNHWLWICHHKHPGLDHLPRASR